MQNPNMSHSRSSNPFFVNVDDVRTSTLSDDSEKVELQNFLETCGISKHFATFLSDSSEVRVAGFKDLITFMQMENNMVSRREPMLNDPQWQRGVWNSIINIDSQASEKKSCMDFIALVASNLHKDKDRPVFHINFSDSAELVIERDATMTKLREKKDRKKIDASSYRVERKRTQIDHQTKQDILMTRFFQDHKISIDFVHTLRKRNIMSLYALHKLIDKEIHADQVDILTPFQRHLWNLLVTSETSPHDRQLVENFIRNDRVLALVNEEEL